MKTVLLFADINVYSMTMSMAKITPHLILKYIPSYVSI